jgi:cytoplasmic FMR1 interacting protein
MWQLQLVKMAKDADSTESTHVKEDMYLVIVEGFQLLSEWTGRIWEQSAWKFSRPAKDATPFDPERSTEVTDYEKVANAFNFSFQLYLNFVFPHFYII